MKRAELRPNPHGYRDNLIEIFTSMDSADLDRAVSSVKQYKSLAQEVLSRAGLPGGGIDFGLLDRALHNLNQQQTSLAREALVQFDIAFCNAVDSQSFVSRMMNRQNRT